MVKVSKQTWEITARVPISEMAHFNVRGMNVDALTKTVTNFLAKKKGSVNEIKRELRGYESDLEEVGIHDFSLSATPLRER